MLLFTKDPSVAFPTAMIKCARYYGDNRTAEREIETFEGTVMSEIIAARDFLAERVQVGESPSAHQAQLALIYDYPMVAVREIIANALVHRDYSVTETCVHVRLFADRLECSSPGSWFGRDLSPNTECDLADLAGQSIKRNFRLAHILSWARLVEGKVVVSLLPYGPATRTSVLLRPYERSRASLLEHCVSGLGPADQQHSCYLKQTHSPSAPFWPDIGNT